MKLGFGMMRLPRMEGTNDIDLEHTKRMVDAFIEAGGMHLSDALSFREVSYEINTLLHEFMHHYDYYYLRNDRFRNIKTC